MKIDNEPGVLPSSERFFGTPSETARRNFFYITRAGHYYYDQRYDFRYTSETARQKSHQNYFLNYVRKGAVYLQTENTVFRVRQGQIGLVNCRRPHRFYTKGNAESLWIHFDGTDADRMVRRILAESGGQQSFSPENPLTAEKLMTGLISGMQEEFYSEAEQSVSVYSLLCTLVPGTRKEAGYLRNGVFLQAREYILAHLSESVSVKNMADATNLSESQFSRIFRSKVGFAPHEYVMTLRLNKAKELLTSTELPLREIAEQVGYSSDITFITAFRGKTGMSPTEFRNSRTG
jgi:AraC family transcriptional regulator